MPRSSTVQEPAELLSHLFATWTDVKKKQIRTWLKFQAITVNGRPVSQFDHPLQPGDVVALHSERYTTPRDKLDCGIKIYFEDADIMVIDKPEDLLSIASEAEQEETAYFQLNEHLKLRRERARERIWIVHRLDRETSGLMIFAKTPEAKEFLQSNWDRATKKYEAVAEGKLTPDSGTFESDLNETNPFRVFSAKPSEVTRHAITHYRVVARNQGRTLVELTLETGRRHQIRVHLADAGHPIIGDEKYAARSNPAKRLGLHSCFLQFPHPTTGEEMRFTSPLPKTLARLV